MPTRTFDKNSPRWGDIWHEIDDSWSSHDHVRHFMYSDIFSTLSALSWEYREHTLIEFGCHEPTSAIIRMLVYLLQDRLNPTAVDYPAVDLHKTDYADGEWDITVADQVLEHTQRPWLCAEELYRITKPGGLCIVATPIILHVHPNPLDCWRIMPDGYKVIFPEEKWQYLEFGMWGDRHLVAWECESPVTRGFTGDWLSVRAAKEAIPNYGQGTDGSWPVVIWWIGRKK